MGRTFSAVPYTYLKRGVYYFVITGASLLYGCKSVVPENIQYRAEHGSQSVIRQPIYITESGKSATDLALMDFGGRVYRRTDENCGFNGAQKGDRDSSPALAVIGKKNVKITNGHFECSTQNTIWIKRSENIILNDISSWLGSDNALEIRDSKYVIVKNATLGKAYGNKCLETENSIVILYNVTMHDCLKGFAGERTSPVDRELVLFIDSVISLRPDRKNYDFVCDTRVEGSYGAIALVGTSRNSRNINCEMMRSIPDGLVSAIERDDIPVIRRLLEPVYESLNN